MTITIARNNERSSGKPTARGENGFSLLELTLAMAIFVAISGVAFSLFNQQQKSSRLLQGQTQLNISLRNAAAELQMDLAGAGSGYFQGVNMPGWPVAVTITNNMSTNGTSCYNSSTKSYSSACYDRLSIIAAAPYPANCSPGSCYPPIYAIGSGGTGCSVPYAAGGGTVNAYGQAAVVNGATWTLTQTAAEFKQNDQLLLMNNAGTSLTSVVLTADAVVSGSTVKFAFKSTNSDGSNTLDRDPLDITACDNNYGTGFNQLGCATHNTIGPNPLQFCSTDYILKLAPIIYMVCSGPNSDTFNATWCDQSSNSPDIQDPKLVRIQNGKMSVVMDQVIGFRVGAALWNSSYEAQDNDSVTTSYNYLASTYCLGGAWNTVTQTCSSGVASPWNFSLVRAVRVSLIGRTAPSNIDNEFKNAFDQGNYQVQGMAVVVNPRNSSMNDN